MTSCSKLTFNCFCLDHGKSILVPLNPISHHLLFTPGQGAVVIIQWIPPSMRGTFIFRDSHQKPFQAPPFLQDKVKFSHWYSQPQTTWHQFMSPSPTPHHVPGKIFNYTQCFYFLNILSLCQPLRLSSWITPAESSLPNQVCPFYAI